MPLIAFPYYWPFCYIICKRIFPFRGEAIFYSIISAAFLSIMILMVFVPDIIKILWLMLSVAIIVFSYYKRSVLINGVGLVLLISVVNPIIFIGLVFTSDPISLYSIIIIGILLFIAGIIQKIIAKDVVFLDIFSSNFLTASYAALLMPASYMILAIVQTIFGVPDSTLGVKFNFLTLFLGLSAILLILAYLKAFMGKKDKK